MWALPFPLSVVIDLASMVPRLVDIPGPGIPPWGWSAYWRRKKAEEKLKCAKSGL
jgi:hypothetical protein